MASPAVNLDQGPPLPPNLQPPQQASLQGLAGQPAPNPAGSASLQQAIIEKLMFVESTLNDIAKMMPDAAPIAAGLIDSLRKGMGAVLAKGAQPPAAPPPAGMMMMPGGAPGQ